MTEHADGALTIDYRCVYSFDVELCACSSSDAVVVSVYVYCNSAAYCDSKFLNTSAVVDGYLTSSDPGTVKSVGGE